MPTFACLSHILLYIDAVLVGVLCHPLLRYLQPFLPPAVCKILMERKFLFVAFLFVASLDSLTMLNQGKYLSCH